MENKIKFYTEKMILFYIDDVYRQIFNCIKVIYIVNKKFSKFLTFLN